MGFWYGLIRAGSFGEVTPPAMAFILGFVWSVPQFFVGFSVATSGVVFFILVRSNKKGYILPVKLSTTYVHFLHAKGHSAQPDLFRRAHHTKADPQIDAGDASLLMGSIN